jgi:hypothetical protein
LLVVMMLLFYVLLPKMVRKDSVFLLARHTFWRIIFCLWNKKSGELSALRRDKKEKELL